MPVKYRVMLARMSRAALFPGEMYHHGNLVDISAGGMGLLLHDGVLPGQKLEVYVSPSLAGERGILATVEVVRSVKTKETCFAEVRFEERNNLS